MSSLAEQMQSLYREFGELPGVSIELHRDLIAVQVENRAASATVFLQGAQLSHYQRKGEQPVIWCSPRCDFQTGSPLRGGIPVCWPWFGALEKNPPPVRQQLQALSGGSHGLVRERLWQLARIETPDPATTTLTFTLPWHDGQPAGWPAGTDLSLHIEVGSELTTALRVHNHSSDTVCFSAALHSYFAVSDIADVSIDGLDGLDYLDTLRGWSNENQRGSVRIDGEIDRIYLDTQQPIRIVDSGWQRSVEIACRGSNSAIVWNPWIEKSRRLSQFAEDAYRSMLCIETANADRDFVSLAPSAQHELAAIIRCLPLH